MIGLFKQRRPMTEWQRKVAAARSIMAMAGADSSGMTDEEVVEHVTDASARMHDAMRKTCVSVDEAGRALSAMGSALSRA